MKALEYLLEGIGLRKYYAIKRGSLRKRTLIAKAVDGVDLRIRQGETFALVGESGSGKTTLGKMLISLIETTEGQVLYKGKNIFEMTKEERGKFRSKMQIIFQDPDASLNPKHTIRKILSLPFQIHAGDLKKHELEEKIIGLLGKVGLEPPQQFINSYPHELSGGQKQRVGIARAVALNPELVVADEPVSSLDVSVRAQILKLMKNLQQEMNITYLFITHDLAVVRAIAHNVATMYLGKIVESGTVRQTFESALHPYTQSLLLSTPIPRPAIMQKRVVPQVTGEVPSPINPPSGCRFHPRCRYAQDICSKLDPDLLELERDHVVACHVAAHGGIKPVDISVQTSVE